MSRSGTVKNPTAWNSRCGTEETNPTRNHEVADLIPGLTQWVTDPVLPRAVVWVAEAARIPSCCAGSSSSDSAPNLRTSIVLQVWP